MEYILSIGGLLIGALFFQWQKRKSAEAVLDNVETNKKVDQEEAKVIKNEALAQAEEEKRLDIKNQGEEKKNEKDNLDDLERFFNSKGG